MKKTLLALALLALGCSTPTVDPDNGVSNASYRQAITTADKGVAQIVSRIRILKERDLEVTDTHRAPLHDADWWDAEIRLEESVRDLLEATLKGAAQ